MPRQGRGLKQGSIDYCEVEQMFMDGTLDVNDYSAEGIRVGRDDWKINYTPGA